MGFLLDGSAIEFFESTLGMLREPV